MSSRDPVQDLLDRLDGVKPTGSAQWQARCPAHDDKHASLSIGRGEGGRALIDCKAGCPTPEVLKAIGLRLSDLYAPDAPRKPQGKGRIVKPYPYRNAAGELLYEVVRYDPKGFRQRRPDGKGGWAWNMNGVPRVPYRLPELLAADRNAWAFIVEGEKDADNLAALGLVATTNPGGAGKWGKLADDSALHGRRLAIIADKDTPGFAHAQDVAARTNGKAAVVKIIDLPDMPGKDDGFGGKPRKDVSDWIEWLDGKTAEDLAAALVGMAEAAPPWMPKAAPPADEAPTVLDSTPVLRCMADVQPREIRWFWPGRIAAGKLTLLVGDPGLGKSFLTLDMAARATCGLRWPDCPQVENPIGGVVLLSAEDDPEDTIRPRLDAAGADVGRIVLLEAVDRLDMQARARRRESFDLSRDLPALERAIAGVPDCRLVIIDPISSYMGGTDSHKNADVRAVLAPLTALATKCRVAIVAVTHLRKGDGVALYRAMGSLAFVAAARAAYGVVKDKLDPTGARRLMLPLKNNLSGDTTGLAYRLDKAWNAKGMLVVKWEAQPVTVTADEAMKPDRPGSDTDGGSALGEAREWLESVLADGPVTAKEIITRAGQDGISKKTLERAKKALDVKAEKGGFDAGWTWRLHVTETAAPEERQERQEGPQQKTLATFGGLGNLRPA